MTGNCDPPCEDDPFIESGDNQPVCIQMRQVPDGDQQVENFQRAPSLQSTRNHSQAELFKKKNKCQLWVQSINQSINWPWVERGLWIFLAIVSFTISVILINRMWVRWKTEPIIVSSQERTHVVTIPFPAITICSETKVARRKFNVTKHYLAENRKETNLTLQREKELVSIFCNRNIVHSIDDMTDYALNKTDFDFLHDVRPYNYNSFRVCFFNPEMPKPYCYTPISDQIMTDEGICFSWNMLNPEDFYSESLTPSRVELDELGKCVLDKESEKNMTDNNDAEKKMKDSKNDNDAEKKMKDSKNDTDAERKMEKNCKNLNLTYKGKVPKSHGWNKDKSYTESLNLNLRTYPLRTSLSGRKSGLKLTISINGNDMDDICTGSGFKVFVHNPTEMISSSMDHFLVPLNREVEIAVKPKKVVTDSTLKRLSPMHRQCYFPDEFKLAYYKVYTQQNCQLECLTNYTLKECGCVSYYMPRIGNTCVCSPKESVDCIGGIIEGRNDYNEVDDFNQHHDPRVLASCKCLPACTSLKYEGGVKSNRVLNWKTNLGFKKKSIKANDESSIRIYYEDDHFVTTHRHEFYGYLDFFADCGGLLVLCCGLSFICLLRILYSLVVRNFDKKIWELNKSIEDETGIYRYEKDRLNEENHRPLVENNVGENCLSCRQKSVLKHTFLDYCKFASLPVIKYTVEKDRPWIERGWWIFITIVGFMVSIYYIRTVVIKWDNSPVIISPAQQSSHVFDIPFPAITICSQTKVKPSVFNFTDFYQKVGDNQTIKDVEKYAKSASALCGQWRAELKTAISDINKFNESDVDIIEELGERNEFTNDHNDVTSEFRPILTMDGLCYTRNMLSHRDLFTGDGLTSKYLRGLPPTTWTIDGGYENKDKDSTEPLYPKRQGTKRLKIELYTTDKDWDRNCKGTGYQVYLHNPAEVITQSTTYYKVNLNTELDIAIKPDKMFTDEGMRSFPPEHRQCYFSDERKLSYYKVYTQQNCEMECLVNETLKKCNCVAYYMPRSANTTICGVEDMICVNCVRDIMYSLTNEESVRPNYENQKRCNCLMPCMSLQYEGEALLNIMDLHEEADTTSITTVINVYYKKERFFPIRRSGMYDIIQFLSACGGYLGLFSGCGLLAILEMIYYATFRLYNNWKLKQKTV